VAEAQFQSFDVSLRRRNPWLGLLAVALMTVAPAVLLALSPAVSVLVGVAPLAAFLGVALWNANVAQRERLGRLVVGDLGVFFEQRRLCARADVRGGSLLHDGSDAPIVRIETARGTFDLRVPDAAAGRRLIRFLGRDAPLGTLRARLSSQGVTDPGRLATAGMVALLGAALFPLMGYAWNGRQTGFFLIVAGCAFALALVMAYLFASTTISLSPEGVSVRWLLRRQLFRYADIEAVRVFDERSSVFGAKRQRGIAIHLRSGDVVRLPDDPGAATDLGAVVERIRDALARSGRGDAIDGEPLLERRGRSPAEWLRAVRGLGSGANADHRTAPVRPETLWRIVEDPTAGPEARAGAAVALQERLDDEGRTRLRIAALSADTPGLRLALEAAAAEADDAELEGALEELARRART
jgi:hypothetical protein